MSSPDAPRTPPQSDDAWKERVRAEAAAHDAAQHAAAHDPPAAGGADAAREGASDPRRARRPQIDARQLPPASLTTLVTMLSTQAMVALGVLPDPGTGEADPQPALARHFIDLIGVVEEKTKENCTIDEQRMLNSTLHELRMAFVQMSRESPASN
jgi:hypothetical protein